MIVFVMWVNCVLFEVETKCLGVVYVKVSLQNEELLISFLIFVAPIYVCCWCVSTCAPKPMSTKINFSQNLVSCHFRGDIYFKDE